MKNAGTHQTNNYNAHREGKNASIRLFKARPVEYRLPSLDSAQQKAQGATLHYWHDKLMERHEELQFELSAAFSKQQGGYRARQKTDQQ
ncbi:hypothetical protein MMC15_000111 [Xylographa vitiligo]|nr:hypothetical protein [Xylographa vitiligo]